MTDSDTFKSSIVSNNGTMSTDGFAQPVNRNILNTSKIFRGD